MEPSNTLLLVCFLFKLFNNLSLCLTSGTITTETTPESSKVSFTDVGLTIPTNKYQLDGHMQLNKGKGYDVDLSAKYNNLAESITLKSSYEHVEDKSAHFDVEFKMSKYPESAFAAIYDGKRDQQMVKRFYLMKIKIKNICLPT